MHTLWNKIWSELDTFYLWKKRRGLQTLYVEILYSDSLRLCFCLCACIQFVWFTKDGHFSNLEFDCGHMNMAQNHVSMFSCPNPCQLHYVHIFSLELPKTHTFTHIQFIQTFTHTTSPPSLFLKPSLTYQSDYHVNSFDMVRLGGW